MLCTLTQSYWACFSKLSSARNTRFNRKLDVSTTIITIVFRRHKVGVLIHYELSIVFQSMFFRNYPYE
jgi:hypothetical protein